MLSSGQFNIIIKPDILKGESTLRMGLLRLYLATHIPRVDFPFIDTGARLDKLRFF